MKNTFKLIGFIAVVAVIGLSFAACDDDGTEYSMTFENACILTKIDVRVDNATLEDGSRAIFTLEGKKNIADNADSKTVFWTGSSKTTFGWNIQGMTQDVSEGYLEEVKQVGNKVTFRLKDD
jgi:hypothetical protein